MIKTIVIDLDTTKHPLFRTVNTILDHVDTGSCFVKTTDDGNEYLYVKENSLIRFATENEWKLFRESGGVQEEVIINTTKEKVMTGNIIENGSLQLYVDRLDAAYHGYMTKNFPTLDIPRCEVKKGRRFAKIVRGGSVYAFVEIETGDIYMAASYKTPAKHIRGSLYDQSGGMDCSGPNGIKSLR